MGIDHVTEKLARDLGVSRAEARRVLDALFSPEDGLIVQALLDGETVAIQGFGKFELADRKGRTVPNPRTGAPVEVPPHRAPTWRAFSPFKSRVNP